MQFSYRISSVSDVNATFENLLCIGTVVQFAEVQPCCVKLWLVSDEIHQLHKQFGPAEYHHKVVPKERACKWANSPYEVEGTYDPSPTPPSSTMVPSEFQPTAAPLPVNNPNLKLAILFYNSRLTRFSCIQRVFSYHSSCNTISPFSIVRSLPFDKPIPSERCPIRTNTQSTFGKTGGWRR